MFRQKCGRCNYCGPAYHITWAALSVVTAGFAVVPWVGIGIYTATRKCRCVR